MGPRGLNADFTLHVLKSIVFFDLLLYDEHFQVPILVRQDLFESF